jgi:hypothetical protein
MKTRTGTNLRLCLEATAVAVGSRIESPITVLGTKRRATDGYRYVRDVQSARRSNSPTSPSKLVDPLVHRL